MNLLLYGYCFTRWILPMGRCHYYRMLFILVTLCVGGWGWLRFPLVDGLAIVVGWLILYLIGWGVWGWWRRWCQQQQEFKTQITQLLTTNLAPAPYLELAARVTTASDPIANEHEIADDYQEYATLDQARQAAEQGSVHGQCQYGQFLLKQAQISDACQWLRKASARGYLMADYELGMLFHPQTSDWKNDGPRCHQYLERVAAAHSETLENLATYNQQQMRAHMACTVKEITAIRQANRVLAELYFSGRGGTHDVQRALTYIQTANQGHNDAQWLYYQGYIASHLAASDPHYLPAVLSAFEKSARTGFAPGALKAGKLYLLNEAVSNEDKALYWLTQAATSGMGEAYYYVGLIYASRRQNPQQARDYFYEAAKQGVTLALKGLAVCCFHPQGAHDVAEGMKWALLCQRVGHEDADQLLARGTHLSAEQFNVAAHQAEHFYETYLKARGVH